MIVDYIDAHRHLFGVDPICRVLTEHGMAITPSTYYARKKAGAVSEAVLAEAYAAHAISCGWRTYNADVGIRSPPPKTCPEPVA